MTRAALTLFALMAIAPLDPGPAAAQASVQASVQTPVRAPADAAPAFEVGTVTTNDGVTLPIVMTYPASGVNTGGAAILHLPDGPGISAVQPNVTSRYVAGGLARLGYTSLSLEPRYAQSYAFSRFDDAINDVRAAVDLLQVRGFSNIVLAGHGLGSLLAARYMAETADGRIKAVASFAPSTDLAEAWRASMGEEKYWATVESASKAVSAGGRGEFIDLGDGLIFTPASFLDWYGPTAKTSLTANMAGIDKPMFLAAGDRDAAVPKGRLERLKAVAFLSKQIDLKYYPGAGHDLTAARDPLIADVGAWLGKLNLTPPPRAVMTIVDAAAKDGTPLAAVLYAPAVGADRTRPAILIAHGWTSDIMRGAPHWLAQRLAQHGYTVLAFQTRASGFRGVVKGKLEDIPQDIAAWVNFMSARGHTNLVAAGHSTGALWFSYYLNETKDARLKAAVYLAPMRDMPAHARTAMGEDRYARAVLEAGEAVRDGMGSSRLINTPFPQATYEDDPRQPMVLSVPGSGFTYYYADSFLSYWGPNSKAVHTRLVANSPIPILAVGGSRDPLMQGAYLIQFTQAAGPKGAYIFYGGAAGATNSFDGYETRLTDDIISWLRKTLSS